MQSESQYGLMSGHEIVGSEKPMPELSQSGVNSFAGTKVAFSQAENYSTNPVKKSLRNAGYEFR